MTIICTVTNDLAQDQRMDRICRSLILAETVSKPSAFARVLRRYEVLIQSLSDLAASSVE